MPTLTTAGDSRLKYLDRNAAASRAVVLLHGLGADSSSWALQIQALTAAGFRCIAPDAPGFGQSSAPRRVRSITELAGFLPELLDSLAVPQADLVGISMGGTLALQFALDHPHRVRRLVLVNTFAHLDLSNPRVWPYYLTRFVLVHVVGLPAQAKAVAMRIFPADHQEELRRLLIAQILQVQPGYYRSALRALAAFNVEARLDRIRCPVLVITGERDTTVPLAVQKRLARGIAAARQVLIPDAGHAVSVEQPERFNRIVLDFLCDN